MQVISREELKKMMDEQEDFVLIEVLGPTNYQEWHLPGAINVPVANNFSREVQEAVPDKSKPVVTYCSNTDCPASGKAAEVMEKLGYQHVYRYQAGKKDWSEAGLPTES